MLGAALEARRIARIRLVGVSLAIAIFFSLQLVLWNHVSDDAFVTFRYVDRFLGGHGFTFGDGERVEGFSHPLWLFILVVARSWPTTSVDAAARAAGTAATLLTLISVLWLRPKRCSDRSFGRYDLGAIVAAGLWLIFPGTHIYASAGLETPLLAFLLTFGTLIGAAGRMRLAALAFGLAGITRPEGLLYGILWLLFTFPWRSKADGWLSRENIRAAIVLTPALLYEVFRVVYYDAWLPNSVWAKPPGTFGGLFGLDYLWQAFVAAGGIVVVGLMGFVRLESDEGARLYRHIAGPILASVIFVLYAWGDWMPFSRFLTPVWPLVTLAIAHWIVGAANALSGRVRYLGVKGTIALLFSLFALSTLGAYGADLVRYASNDGLAANLMRGEDQLAVGRWLAANVAPGSTVVTTRLGAMSYAAPKLTFWDERGLTDREQALWIARGRPGGDAASPVYQRDPDVVAAIAVPASWSYTENEFLTGFLASRYRLVKTFPQGNYGEIHIWLRSPAAEP